MKHVLLALCLVVACTESRRAPERSAAAGAAGAAPEAVQPFGVEFEELALDGEPMFVTDFAFYPGSDTDLLALDKSGKLRRYRLNEQSASLIGTAQVKGVYDRLDCGAISLAFDSELGDSNYLYVGACTSLTHSDILRLDLDDDLNVVEDTEVSVLSVGSNAATRPGHNVGSIGFEPSGVLWALFGDKGQSEAAQDKNARLGKLLRVLPRRKPGLGGSTPAPDGPLLRDSRAEPSLYAQGLRSPFRGTRDSRGYYWIGDVGSDDFEEVNVVREPLTNLGWPDREGPCAGCDGTTPPAFAWPHGASADYILDDPDVETTIARVAWVGPEVQPHEPDRYEGRLAGSVLFGDYCAGFVRHGQVDDDGVPTLDAHLGHLNNASAFRQHSDGFVYAMTFGRCQTDVKNQADEGQSRLYRMVPRQ